MFSLNEHVNHGLATPFTLNPTNIQIKPEIPEKRHIISPNNQILDGLNHEEQSFNNSTTIFSKQSTLNSRKFS